MADTPREKTRSNWWILALVAVVVLAAVVWWSVTRSGEEIGGSISMGETTAAPADSAYGPSPLVPEQAQPPE